MQDPGLDEERELLVQAAAEARLLAAEREHEIIELRKRLDKLEAPIQDEEDVNRDDEEFSELLSKGNESYTQGEKDAAIQTYLSAIASLWRRYQEEKQRTRARVEIEAEVRQKWVDDMSDKENQCNLKIQQLEEEHRTKLQAQQVDFIIKLEEQQKDYFAKSEKQKKDYEAKFAEATERAQALLSENTSLNAEVTRLQAVADASKQAVSNMESSLREAKDKTAEVSEELDKNKEKIKRLWMKHQALKEESAKKDGLLTQSRTEVENLKAKALVDAVPRIVGLAANQARVEELEKDLLSIRAMFERESVHRIQEAEARLIERDEHIQKVQWLEQRVGELEVEKADFDSKLGAVSTFGEQQSALLAQEAEARRTEQEKFRVEREGDLEKIQQLELRLQELESTSLSEREELNFECAALREDLLVSSNRVITAENLLRDMETRLQDSLQAKATLEAEMARLASARESLEELESKLELLEAEKQTLGEQLRSQGELVSVAEAKYEQAQSAKEMLESELSRLSSDMIADRVSKLAGLSANQARIEELELMLEQQKSALETSATQAEETLRTYREEITVKIAALEARAAEAEKLSTETSQHSQSHIAKLDEELLVRETRIASLESEVVRLKSFEEEFAKAQMQLSEISTTARVDSELSTSQNQLITVQEELARTAGRVKEMEDALAEERDKYELLNVEMDDLMGERNALKASLDLELTRSREQSDRIQYLETELAKVKNEALRDRSTRIVSLEANAARIHELEENLRNLSGSTAQPIVDNAGISVAQLAKEPEVVASNFMENVVKRIPNLDVNAQRIFELEAELAQVKDANSSRIFQLEADLLRAKDEIELRTSSERNIQAMETELEGARRALLDVESQLQSLQAERTEMQQLQDRMKEELELFKKQAEPINSENAPLPLVSPRSAALVVVEGTNAVHSSPRQSPRMRAISLERAVVNTGEDDLVQQARVERDEAIRREQDLGAECEALRRRLQDMSEEAEMVKAAAAATLSNTSPVVPLSAGTTVPSSGSMNELESQSDQNYKLRAQDLETELKRVRAESAFNVKNLQAECEALRRRVEDLGIEQDVRQQRERASSEDYSLRTLPAGPASTTETREGRIRRQVSEVESQRRGGGRAGAGGAGGNRGVHARLMMADNVDNTPESQSRHQPALFPSLTDLPKIQSFDEPVLASSMTGGITSVSSNLPHLLQPPHLQDREKELEEELRRVRNESASTIKNLQSECEALHRRVEDLEVECEAHHKADVVLHDGQGTAERGEVSVLPLGSTSEALPAVGHSAAHLHQRTFSEVESQRNSAVSRLVTAAVAATTTAPDTPESQRHLVETTVKIRNPVRALRLTTQTPPRVKQQQSHQAVAATAADETTFVAAQDRIHELEDELKRTRQEYSANTKNLQAECEALRRRLHEVGTEFDAREQQQGDGEEVYAMVNGSEQTVTAIPPRSISALESQRSLSQTSLVVLEEESEHQQTVIEATSERIFELEQELTRLREESSVNIRNFQAETEALRRRIADLELEKTAETELIRKQEHERLEAERLRRRVQELEVTAKQAKQSEVEALRLIESVTVEKDRELREALEKLQQGNETLDDLRMSIQGSQGKLTRFGTRAHTLVESIERLQAERDAMKIQIREAYGVSLHEEEAEAGEGQVVHASLDHAVDAAHAAGDDALNVAKSLAEELDKIATEDDLATTLAEALGDAQACLQLALQFELDKSRKPLLLNQLTPALESVTQAISQVVPESVLGTDRGIDTSSTKVTTANDDFSSENPSSSLVLNRTLSPQTQSTEEEEEEEAAAAESKVEIMSTQAGEETVESRSSAPAAPTTSTATTTAASDFFIQRILELERERASLMDRLSRAETELQIRKDIFSYTQDDRLGGPLKVEYPSSHQLAGLATPSTSSSKFAALLSASGSHRKRASSLISSSSSAVTPWKNSTWKDAKNWTPVVVSRSIPRSSSSTTEMKQEESQEASSADWGMAHQQQHSQQSQAQWGSSSSSADWANDKWSQQQSQQQVSTSEIPSSWSQPPPQQQQPQQEEDPFATAKGATATASTVPHQPPSTVPTMTPASIQPPRPPPPPSSTAASATVPSTSTAKKQKKQHGPGILAIAFGIGTYHPEWKPNPKELDEDNSDFEEEDQHQQQQRAQEQSTARGPSSLSLPPMLDDKSGGEDSASSVAGSMADPFTAAKAANSPRFQQDQISTDPFAAAARPRRFSTDSHGGGGGGSRRPSAMLGSGGADWAADRQPIVTDPSSANPPHQQPRASFSLGETWPAATNEGGDYGQQQKEANASWPAAAGSSDPSQQEQVPTAWPSSSPGAAASNEQWSGGQQWSSDHQQQSHHENVPSSSMATATNEWGEHVSTGIEPSAGSTEWGSEHMTTQGEPSAFASGEWGENEVTREEPSVAITNGPSAADLQEDISKLTNEVSELSKQKEDLQQELQAEREARLYRESQYEFAEANLYAMIQEAEELKRQIRALGEQQQQVQQQSMTMMTPSQAQQQQGLNQYYDEYGNVLMTPPTTMNAFEPHMQLQEQEQPQDSAAGQQPQYDEFGNVIPTNVSSSQEVAFQDNHQQQHVNEELARQYQQREEEFFMLRSDLETKLQNALQDIEDLQRQLIVARTEEKNVRPLKTDDDVASKVVDETAKDETRENDSTKKVLEEDVARLTSQLANVTYSLYRTQEDSANQTSMTSTLSLAVASFAISAFVPSDALVIKVVNLLSGE